MVLDIYYQKGGNNSLLGGGGGGKVLKLGVENGGKVNLMAA